MIRRLITVFVASMALCAGAVASQDRHQGGLNPGDLAADFTLEPRGGGAPITLSAFRDKKPVALVFGSYT